MAQTLSPAPYLAHYEALKGSLPGATAPWLAERREAAAARLRALGLPSVRQETWKYTNLKGLAAAGFAPAREVAAPAGFDALPSLLPDSRGSHRLVFVNGLLRPELSRLDGLPDGVRIDSLAARLERDPGGLQALLGAVADDEAQPLLALNSALLDDGLLLQVPAGTTLDRPIEALFLGGLGDRPSASHPRLLVSLGRASAATLIEQHVGLGATAGLSNVVTEVDLAAGAQLSHLKLQAENTESLHLATSHLRLARDAGYRALTLTTGAALSRHEIRLRLEGEGAEAHLNGAYLLRGEQHGDTTSVIEHRVPHTASTEVYKGALDDSARAVFQGKIVVERDAQKSDGRMLNKTLLLSDTAEIDSKPELEIFADDVQCAHGATAGELDAEALFYLRSRGIAEDLARSLLVEAFLAEAVSEVADEDLREALLARVRAWLQRG